MAGFEGVRLIDEAAAVALALAARGVRGRLATCSWGAGFLSCAIVEIQPPLVRVLSTGGSGRIGGDRVDLKLAQDLLTKVKEEVGVLQNEIHVARHILSLAEGAKRDLVRRGKTELSIQFAGRGRPIRCTYSVQQLEQWLEPLKEEAQRVCRQLLEDARVQRGDLEGLALAGGMSHLASLREFLAGQFGRESVEGLDPEELAIQGATARGRLLDHETSDILLFDGLSHGLGLEGPGGSIVPILQRGISLPASKREVFTTYLERQTEVAIQLYGSAGAVWRPLARVEVAEIPPMPAGQPVLEVAFLLDEDGILETQASETTRSKPLRLELRPERGLASSAVQATLESLPQVNQESFEQDVREEMRQRGRFLLDTLKELSRRSAGVMTRDEKQLITKKSRELEEVMGGADPAEIRACSQELEEVARPLMQRDVDTSLQSLLR
jgi:molecular chaperone DnaK (HSP70)